MSNPSEETEAGAPGRRPDPVYPLSQTKTMLRAPWRSEAERLAVLGELSAHERLAVLLEVAEGRRLAPPLGEPLADPAGPPAEDARGNTRFVYIPTGTFADRALLQGMARRDVLAVLVEAVRRKRAGEALPPAPQRREPRRA